MKLMLLGYERNSLDIGMHWPTPSLAPVSKREKVYAKGFWATLTAHKMYRRIRLFALHARGATPICRP